MHGVQADDIKAQLAQLKYFKGELILSWISNKLIIASIHRLV